MVTVIGACPSFSYAQAEPLRRVGEHIALIVERDIDAAAVLLCFAAPDSLIVLLELRDVRVSFRFDARLRFAFGKAVRAGHRTRRIVAFLRADYGILRSFCARRDCLM